MRLIAYYTPGKDYPPNLKNSKMFEESLERTIRKRLELREFDIVEIHGVNEDPL